VEIRTEPGHGFSFADYRGALTAFLADGYKVTGFGGFLDAPAQRHLVLRHDCDNSLEQAMRIAEIDAEEGCSSTFFVRIHARGYNLFSLPSLLALDRLAEMGHEVELHLEAGIPEVLKIDLHEFVDRQRDAFTAAVGRPPRGLSSHEPARMGQLDLASELVARWGLDYHAYDPRFTDEMKYISDSSGRWREGHFRDWVGVVDRLQVLVHPIWWFDRVPQENT
jgi:hypothetical protein